MHLSYQHLSFYMYVVILCSNRKLFYSNNG
uniref:Uncharacterized protein n=1 Tax=Rhizophora mucronata TaxID=61149 RepID=A0A2P2NLL2_RHIMU